MNVYLGTPVISHAHTRGPSGPSRAARSGICEP